MSLVHVIVFNDMLFFLDTSRKIIARFLRLINVIVMAMMPSKVNLHG